MTHPSSPPRAALWFAVTLASLASSCANPARCVGTDCLSPAYTPAPVPASLDASFDDPILLTVAAPRARTHYLGDQGYSLARDASGVISLVTASAGSMGLAFAIGDTVYAREADYAAPVRIVHTASDAMVYAFSLGRGIDVEVRFVVATSRVASADVWLHNTQGGDTTVSLRPWLRRCNGLDAPTPMRGGVTVRHHLQIDPLLRAAGQGTFVTDFAGALQTDGDSAPWAALTTCGETLLADVSAIARTEPLAASATPPTRVGMVSLRRDVTVPGNGWTRVRVRRGQVPLDTAATLSAELQTAASLDTDTALRDGVARLANIPALPGLTREQQLVYRSSFVLLDQLMMPAEGHMAHDYYLFSREPTWWFSSLGQHAHESLSMILMSRMRPDDAMGSQRVFFENIDPTDYLPYNIGPVVTQTARHTASPPMVSLVAWEIYRNAHDATFLADAYDAGVRLNRFWVQQRDTDHNGLCEWGGYAVSESVRDLHNVIWDEVAPPEQLEAIDLNSWLVLDEQALANMADALGRPTEAQGWRDAASARAARINATMWDEATGFYYHVSRADHSFSFAHPDDLKRLEISGFMPLWAGIVPDARRPRLMAHLLSPAEFWRANGIPGLAATDRSYDPHASTCCRWNGPVWVQWQFLMARALVAAGDRAHAQELTRNVLAAVSAQLRAVHQFRELYSPDDAAENNQSMPNYIWSSMVALMMLENGLGP